MQYMQLNHQDREAYLAELVAMPEYLTQTFASVPLADLRRSEPEGTFNPVEHVWHLVDLERDGFGQRIHRLRTESSPVLPDFDGDQVARQGNYKSRSFDAGIAEFRRLRRSNIATLQTLSPEEWLRSGAQEGVGPVSLCDLPAMMAAHDAAHRVEIAEWIQHVVHGR